MSSSRRFKVQRTITNSVERWMGQAVVLITATLTTMLLSHCSTFLRVLVFLLVESSVYFILIYIYKYLIPTFFILDDEGVQFKGTRYTFDELRVVAVTPKLNLHILLRDKRDALRIRPYHRDLYFKHEVQKWCFGTASHSPYGTQQTIVERLNAHSGTEEARV